MHVHSCAVLGPRPSPLSPPHPHPPKHLSFLLSRWSPWWTWPATKSILRPRPTDSPDTCQVSCWSQLLPLRCGLYSFPCSCLLSCGGRGGEGGCRGAAVLWPSGPTTKPSNKAYAHCNLTSLHPTNRLLNNHHPPFLDPHPPGLPPHPPSALPSPSFPLPVADYACLIVGANAGVVGMCKEHLGVALALRVPCFFVVTKVDLAPEHVMKHTLDSLQQILKKPGVKKRPFLVGAGMRREGGREVCAWVTQLSASVLLMCLVHTSLPEA